MQKIYSRLWFCVLLFSAILNPSTAAAQFKTITIINQVEDTIVYLYARPSSADTDAWGDDLMPSSQTLLSGKSMKIKVNAGSECKFDIQGSNFSGATWLATEQDICRTKTITITEDMQVDAIEERAGNKEITFINESSQSVFYLYIRPIDSGDWGDDVMGEGQVVSASETEAVSMNLHNGCLYDIKGSNLEGTTLFILENMDLCDNDSVTISEDILGNVPSETDTSVESETPSGDSIQVTNKVGETIFYLFARPAGSDDWGTDLLKDAGEDLYTFQNDETGSLVIPGFSSTNCRFDFKGTMLDESKVLAEVYNVDLCSSGRLTFNRGTARNQNQNVSSGNNSNSGDMVEVTNKVGETIFYLFVRRAGSNDWGTDLLKDAGQDLYTFQNDEVGKLRIPGLSRNNCRFDFKGTALSESNVLTELSNVDLCRSKSVTFTRSGDGDNRIASSPTPSGAGKPVQVTNKVGETIFYLYARRAGSSDWGADLLASAGDDLYTFQDNETGSLNLPGFEGNNCRFDFKGTALEQTNVLSQVNNVDLCRNNKVTFNRTGGNTQTPPNNNNNNSGTNTGGNRIQVTNKVGETIFYLFARPSGGSDWGSDLLKDAGEDLYTFQNDETGSLAIPALGGTTCRFDFKATALDEGKVLSQVNNVDLCRNKNLTFKSGTTSGGSGNNTPPPVNTGGNDSGPNQGSTQLGNVRVENQTGDMLLAIKAKATSGSKYSEVFSGKDANNAMGASGTVNMSKFSGQCVFDVKAIGVDADYEIKGIDLCRQGKLRIQRSHKVQ